MADEVKVKVRSDAGSLGGIVWFIGWLFTIGYLHLPFWKAVVAIVIWPYDIGVHFAA
ncbi:MAG TPA: hypothetical protein VMS88_00300 [Terriglobales bacterium]|nr:hypothetical protein [Terriglobales bacterium]